MNIRRVLSFGSVVALNSTPKTPASLALGITLGVALLIGGCAKPAAEAPCGQGLTSCDGTCVNTTNSGSNCGSCGHACSGGQVCDNGSCSSQCSASTRLCGTSCADETTDPTNCGGCGTTCRSDQICNGACVCAPGKTLCNGVCATSCSGTGGSTGVGGHGTGGGTGSGTGGMTGAGGNAGRPGTGGVTGGVGGAGGAGGALTGPPPGYYTSGTLHGCSWTGVDTIAGSGTTNTPTDFVAQSPQGFPYCVHGSVGANPTSSTVALLGFNVNEPAGGAANQCASGAAPTTLPTMVPPANGGIAVSYVRLTGSNIRVQIQGPNGGTDPNDRWCATITQVQGPVFVPLSQFNTACYNNSGTFYPAANPSSKPIAAISFLVPGTVIPSPFSYCVGGFAFGTSVAAAPAYNPNPYPTLTGTIGGADPTNGMAIDFQRVKVAAPGVGGKAYIIQNNNWGTPLSTDQTISYSGNTFTVVNTTGNVAGGVPASFPSIYIGANGQTAGQLPGVLSTTPDGDGLPKAINAIGAAGLMTTFSYSHATNGPGDYNATYDVWLAAPPAPAIGYADALSGFVMVWLYQPTAFNRMPIGTQMGTANIAGHTWNVWVGPRGTGGNAALMNRPVVSYVAPTPLTTLTFDMKLFLVDAASHGIPSTWLVTDVFAGFEIWTGSTAAGLKETGFTATVN